MWPILLAATALSLAVDRASAAEDGHVAPQASPTAATPRRIIIDTDPGIDDAIAILVALRSPELQVDALTTVAGNVPLEPSSDNARRLLSLAHRSDIPVARGAAQPLHKMLHTATHWHGSNGLGVSSCLRQRQRSIRAALRISSSNRLARTRTIWPRWHSDR